MASSYKDLKVRQKAMELVADVYRLTAAFPETEKFGLVTQLRRAAVSIPSNIAEGQGRLSDGEFKQFLGHARGALFEVSTQRLIVKDLGFAKDEQLKRPLHLVDEVGRMLNGLIRSLDKAPTQRRRPARD